MGQDLSALIKPGSKSPPLDRSVDFGALTDYFREEPIQDGSLEGWDERELNESERLEVEKKMAITVWPSQ